MVLPVRTIIVPALCVEEVHYLIVEVVEILWPDVAAYGKRCLLWTIIKPGGLIIVEGAVYGPVVRNLEKPCVCRNKIAYFTPYLTLCVSPKYH